MFASCVFVRDSPKLVTAALWIGIATLPLLAMQNGSRGRPGAPVAAAGDSVANWGRDRLDQPDGLDGRYTPANRGAGVHLYVIDTGITDRHGDEVFPEFRDRAGRSRVVERREIGSSGSPDDCDEKYAGHGTRVASLAAGRTVGVAPDAILHSVKVCQPPCAGANCGVVQAIQSVLSGGPPGGTAVINISFGPLPDSTPGLQDTITRALDAGFVFTVSAGCRPDTSAAFGALADPAFQSRGFLIVGGTDRADRTFRQYGPGLTLYAPSTQTTSVDTRGILSVPPLVNDRPPEYCADSWAAPHAAGVAAVYLERHRGASPSDVYRALVSSAAPGHVTFEGQPVPPQSNRLLQLPRN